MSPRVLGVPDSQATDVEVAAATTRLLSLSGLTTPSTNTGFTAFAGNPTRRSSSAQNDEIGWDVYVPAGTWEFWLVHYAGTTRGIYTVTLDGAALTTFGAGSSTVDGYAGSNAITESTIAGVVVATAGVKRLKVEMDTKNASSSGYVGSVQAIGLRRTA